MVLEYHCRTTSVYSYRFGHFSSLNHAHDMTRVVNFPNIVCEREWFLEDAFYLAMQIDKVIQAFNSVTFSST